MKKHRIISLLLATVIVGSTGAGISEAFGDVKEHWAEKNIKELTDRKILSGYPDGSFRPENRITRAEVAKIITEVIKSDEDIANDLSDPKFNDIKEYWAEAYIAYLSEKGIITGYPDGSFKPDNEISREEFVSIVARVVKEKNQAAESMKSDVKMNDIFDSWAKDDIVFLVNRGLVTGYPDGSFKPGNKMSRAEVSSVIAAVMNNINARTKITDGSLSIEAEDIRLEVGDELDTALLATASDNDEGNLNDEITVSGDLPIKDGVLTEPGDYKIDFSVENDKGNFVTKRVNVQVVENENVDLYSEDKIELNYEDLVEKEIENAESSEEPVSLENGVSREKQDEGPSSVDNAEENSLDKAKESKLYEELTNKVFSGPSTLQNYEEPIISAKNRVFGIGTKIDLKKYANAIDPNEGIITDRIEIEGEVPTENGLANEVGKYQIKYKVKNSEGLTNQKTIEVEIKSANKALLLIALNRAENINKSIYTDESVENLETEIENALRVKNDVNAMPKDINEAVKKLNKSYSDLKAVLVNGTVENPYIISSRADLEKLKDEEQSDTKHYKIVSDIDMGDSEWIPFKFIGNIDGQGHKIINLNVNNVHNPLSNPEKEAGLFTEYGTNKSEIKNIVFENVNISNTYEQKEILRTGTVAGTLRGKASNILVKGNIMGGVTGGIAGYSYNEISQCGFIGKIDGTENVGGIAGYSYSAGISECFAKGYIKGGTYVGGIAGSSSNIKDSYSSALLDGKYVGGLTGSIEVKISSSYSASTLANEPHTKGGLFASSLNSYVSLNHVYFNGDLFPASPKDVKYERTTEEMKAGVSNSDIFNTWRPEVWDISQGKYPKLKWESKAESTDRQLEHIAALSPVKKTLYYIGDEIDLDGLKIAGVYDNGDVELLEVAPENIVGFDSSAEVDSQEVKIKFGELEIGFNVEIRSKDIGLEGDGSEQSPYKITNGEEMKKISKLIDTKGVYFELANDIDMADVEWEAIPFNGNFDGKDFTISNFNYDTNAPLVGLFTVIGSDDYREAEFKNTKFESSRVVNANTDTFGYYNNTRNHTGSVAGESYGKISNVHVNGYVENKKEHIGGLVGDNRGIIEKSSFKGTITETYKNVIEMGGITARNFGTISQSFTEGQIIRDKEIYPISKVGGIAGGLENDSVIDNCYSRMELSARSGIGGIAGSSTSTSTINNSYFAGKIDVGATYASARGGIYAGYSTPQGSNRYYDKDIVGFTETSNPEQQKTTAEMKSGVPFENWSTSIWKFKEGEYPSFNEGTVDDTEGKNVNIKIKEGQAGNSLRTVFNGELGEVDEFDFDSDSPNIQAYQVLENGEMTKISDIADSLEAQNGTAQAYSFFYAASGEELNPEDLLYETSYNTVKMKVVSQDRTEEKTFFIHKFNRKQDAPTGVEAVEASAENANDGIIKNVRPGMQYKNELNDIFYKDINSTEVVGLEPGLYSVRNAEKPGYYASEPVGVIVKIKEAPAEGTEENPIKIGNAEDLKKLSESESNKYYELTSDIDMTDIEWTPVEFSGVLDGKGYSIENLKLESFSPGHLGLISILKDGATVKNLNMKNVSIYNSISNNSTIVSGYGGIAAETEAGSLISSCKVTGTIAGVTSENGGEYLRGYYGGIAGLSRGNVENCYTKIDVSGRANAAGVVGILYGTLKDSYTASTIDSFTRKGTVVSVKSRTGGIIENSYYDTDLSGEYMHDVEELGTGLTTQEMKALKSDNVYKDWDETIWKFSSEDYPTLFWEHEAGEVGDTDEFEYGNSISNLVNDGLVAEKDGFIYYRNSSDGNSLYRSRLDGTEKVKLNSKESKSINIVGDKIYYVDKMGKINKMNLDGSYNETLYPESRAKGLTVVGDSMYFSDDKDFGGYFNQTKYLAKAKTDGTEIIYLDEVMTDNVNVVGDKIYYTVNFTNTIENSNLRSINTDGTDKKEIGQPEEGRAADYFSSMVVDGDRIYYTDRNNRYNLYSMATDGSDVKKLTSEDGAYIGVIGDYIYYKNGDDNQHCYRVKKDGTGREKVLDKNIVMFNGAGGRIYFENTEDKFSLYSMKPDGSDLIKID